MTFTKYFYEALLCGRTIRDSFNGVGKTTVAIMVGRYLNDRKLHFKDGVFSVDAKALLASGKTTTLTEMLHAAIAHGIRRQSTDDFHGSDTPQLVSNLQLFLMDVVDGVMAHFKRQGIDFATEFSERRL